MPRYLKPTSIRFSGPLDPLASDLSVELTSTPPSPLMIHGRAAEQQRLGSGVAGP